MDTGYLPTKADPDVWIRPAVKPDGFQYYESALCYVDNILSILHNSHAMLIALTLTSRLKESK